jgi:HAD superfamily hydrolase (TIGR01509 family)
VLGKVDHKIVAAAVITHRRIWSGFLHTYPGVIRTLIELKNRNLKLCIVSDATRFHVFERLYAMRIVDFFDVVVAHDDTKKYKPARRPFVHALRLAKLKPEDCVMVGDWMKGDVIGAQKLGMKACLAKYGQLTHYTKSMSDAYHLKKFKAKPDYVLRKFEDILKVV